VQRALPVRPRRPRLRCRETAHGWFRRLFFVRPRVHHTAWQGAEERARSRENRSRGKHGGRGRCSFSGGVKDEQEDVTIGASIPSIEGAATLSALRCPRVGNLSV
jgi:hypothetical protein